MSSTRFPCPHCSAPLRVRDRTLVGQPVSCPHCSKPVVITAEGRDEFSIGITDEVRPPAEGNNKRWRAVAALMSAISRSTGPARTALSSPVGIAWLAATAFTALLIAAVWPTSPVHRVERINRSAAAAPDGGDGDATDTGPGPPDAVQDPKDPVRKSLRGLHRRVQVGHDETGTFPAGSVAADGLAVPDRFSWLATLVASGELNAPTPLWDRSWRDPLNDRFVRRSIPELLNPQVDQLTGIDRYPATHFVGIAGVGADAAELPAGHPRAGIFGNERRARFDEIRDGASNTMLAAGVDNRLGAWAAGGEPTVRSFTQEPYVNGPDGFGGGSGQNLPVLMADGSVRLLSPRTDPQLIRRMAAMADGLPLDSSVPGEPGDQLAAATPPGDPAAVAPDTAAKESPAQEPAVPAPAPPPVDVPADGQGPVLVLPAPAEAPDEGAEPQEPPAVDIEAALGVKIVRFSQSQAVPFGRLLTMIEEMVGVPFEWKEEKPPKERESVLQQPTTVDLTNTTLGAILETLLGQVDLTYTADNKRIWLHSASEENAQPPNPTAQEPVP